MTTFATTLAPYIADLIESRIVMLRLHMAEDGMKATAAQIRAHVTEATRLAADLIYTGRK